MRSFIPECGYDILMVFIVLLISEIHYVKCSQSRPQLIAVYPSETGLDTKVSDGVVQVISEKTTRLLFVGLNFSTNTSIVFTKSGAKRGESCEKFDRTHVYRFSESSSQIFEVEVIFSDTGKFYSCPRDDQVSREYHHSGTGDAVTIKAVSKASSSIITLYQYLTKVNIHTAIYSTLTKLKIPYSGIFDLAMVEYTLYRYVRP